MDNLDRTNVVQSSLAKWTLTQQFRELGILKTTEDIDQFGEFMMKFRNSQLHLLEHFWQTHTYYT